VRQFIAASLALAAFASGSAGAVVISNTGSAGGASDPNWSVMWRAVGASNTNSVGSLANAPLVTNIPSPPWQPNVSGNNWLGVNSSAIIPGESGDGSHRYEYAFTTSIDLAASQLVKGAVGFDNFFIGGFVDGTFDTAAGKFMPGTQFLTPAQLMGAGNESKSGFCRDGDGFLPSSSFPTCTVNFAFVLPAGKHNITFVVQGDGVTDGFILNQNGVTLVPPSVPEPSTLALLAIGLGVAVPMVRASRNRRNSAR